MQYFLIPIQDIQVESTRLTPVIKTLLIIKPPNVDKHTVHVKQRKLSLLLRNSQGWG